MNTQLIIAKPLCIIMTRPFKAILSIITALLIIGVFYWNFRIDIEDYFISKRVIYWSENLEIKYSDFEGAIDEESDNNLWYFHGMYLKAKNVKTAYARAIFDKSKSWARDNSTYDFEREIELQQIRFDLYEVYTRKYNSEIEKIRYDESTQYSDLTKIGEKLFGEINVELEKIFDSGLSISEKIRIWRPQIDERLNQTAK